jgi:hypothetical protein
MGGSGMQATVQLPEDVATKLRQLAQAMGLPPREAARVLLVLALRGPAEPAARADRLKKEV